ncbi:MAG: hypothetical protein ACE5FI_08580 [Anaerolineales bacterium]
MRRVSLLIFLAVSSVYFATVSGITSSNDGSHYALLRALVDEGRFEIPTYAQYAEGNDLARVGDQVYSDRPPGTALLAAPLYIVGRALPPVGRALPSRHDAGNPALVYVMLLPVLAGAAAVVIFNALLVRWGVRPAVALLTSLTLAFGTIHWKYSSVLFSHAPSALLVLLAVWIALRAGWLGGLRTGTAFGLGFALGLSVLVEYSNLVFAVLVVLFVCAPARMRPVRTWRRAGMALAAGALLPAAFLAYYNTVNFGAPWTTSYAYAVNYPWAASLATTFDFPLLAGLKSMLFFSADERLMGYENQGLFLLSPVALLAAWGVIYLWRQPARRREALLVLGAAGLYLLLFSKHHTLHGFTGDGRYFAPFLPLALLPLGLWAERHLLSDNGADMRELVFQLLFFGLAFLSVRNIAVHIGFSYNYTLDLSQFELFSASPGNWARLLGALFPNWRNLPLLWGLETAGAAGAWSGLQLQRRRDNLARRGLGD